MKNTIRNIVLLVSVLALSIILTGCSDTAAKTETIDTSYYAGDHVTLCDYKNIELNDDEVKVPESELNEFIQEQFEAYNTTEEITGRGVRSGDIVSLNILGYDHGELVESLETYHFNITVGEGTLGTEFERNIKGMMPGEEKVFNITYEEDYPSETIAGKIIVYEVKVNNIYSQTSYEITDENVEFLSEGAYKTVEEITAVAEKYLLSINFGAYKEKSLLQKIIDSCTINSYPEAKLEEYSNEMISQYMTEAGDMELEEYLASEYNMTMDDFLDYVDEYSKSVLNEEMIFTLIAETEGITVSDEEFDEYVETYISTYQSNYDASMTADDFIDSLGEENIRQALAIKKTKEQILEWYA